MNKPVTPEACGMSSERLARITPFLANYLEKGRIPGYALLLARRGQVVFRSEQGVKDWDTQEAITPDTIMVLEWWLLRLSISITKFHAGLWHLKK